jgi:hypothetical protein
MAVDPADCQVDAGAAQAGVDRFPDALTSEHLDRIAGGVDAAVRGEVPAAARPAASASS